MKIEEYGILFQPMFFQVDPFIKLEHCIKHISENKKDRPSYQLGIKVIWNGKALGWLSLKFVQEIVYISLMESRFKDLDPMFLEKLKEALPPMQDHGKVLVGTLAV